MEEPQFPSNETLERVRSSIRPEELRAHVERICRSNVFDGHTNIQNLLPYLVERAIARRIPTAKEIAREALGDKRPIKGPNLVRTEMGKLRERLAAYYEKDGAKDEIVLEIPKRHYNVLWKHSPHTLLGFTEFGEWVLWSSKLTEAGGKKAAETSRKFWPHLASVFPVYCAEEFDATLDEGKIILPEMVKMFFNSIGKHHLFVTSFDRSQIRIYPLDVWLDQWARIKSSENGTTDLSVYEFWGQSTEIKDKSEVTIHSKLLNALNVLTDEPFRLKLSFHPDGFLHFDVPKPVPRPIGKYNLYVLSFTREDTKRFGVVP